MKCYRKIGDIFQSLPGYGTCMSFLVRPGTSRWNYGWGRIMKAIFALAISVFIVNACAVAPAREDLGVLNAVVLKISLSESNSESVREMLDKNVAIPVMTETDFPHDQLESMIGYGVKNQCGLSAEEWQAALNGLARVNIATEDLENFINDSAYLTASNKNERRGYLSLSQAYVDNDRAFVSVGLSQAAGEIIMVERSGNDWSKMAACAEWSRM